MHFEFNKYCYGVMPIFEICVRRKGNSANDVILLSPLHFRVLCIFNVLPTSPLIEFMQKKPPRRAAKHSVPEKNSRCAMGGGNWCEVLQHFLGKRHSETDSENVIFNGITVVPDNICLVLKTHSAVKALSKAQ